MPPGSTRVTALFSLSPDKLTLGLLFGQLRLDLLNLKQALHNFWPGHPKLSIG